MADLSPLAALLERAGHVFSLADQLARTFEQEHGPPGGFHQLKADAWARHQPAFDDFCAAVLALRDEMQNPPDGFALVAESLKEAASIAKRIRDVMNTSDGRTWQSFLEYRFHLNNVALTGSEAIRVVRTQRIDDPFAFVANSGACTSAEIDTTEDHSEAISVSDLLGYASKVRDSLDDDRDPGRDPALNMLQVAKVYEGACELGLVLRSECPDVLLNREGAKRKLDSLIPLLRARVESERSTSEAGKAREKAAKGLAANMRYDPCDREPRTFGELVVWMVSWADFGNPRRNGLRAPTVAHSADHHYLESYCKEIFGGFDLEALGKLRTRYIVQTRKTVEQVDATKLRDLADHFSALGRQTPVAEPHVATKPKEAASIALLRVFTNGLSDDRIEKAARLLSDDTLTTNEKLTKIDALIPFPATASAEQLGDMLGVSKQAVLKTAWWIQNRKGEKEDEIGRRRAGHKKRAEGYEQPRADDDDER